MHRIFFALLMLAAASAHAADESQVRLAAGPNSDLVQNSCATCHSLDYIQMNSPFLDRKGWETTVNKMINAFHAPIDKANVPAIADYLAKNYGAPGSPASGAAVPGGR